MIQVDMKVDQLQIGLDIRVKFQTSPSAYLDFRGVKKFLNQDEDTFSKGLAICL